LVAGGPVAAKEIKVAGTSQQIRVKPLKVFTEIVINNKPDEAEPWIDRRITKNAFEIWTDKEGWLFDGHGKLLNHAPVPRRDGHGLEWCGAFLPDGQWVTTDLWSYDKSLYLFSKEGKFVRDLAMKEILPLEQGEGIIGWARSDKEGNGWIFAVMGNYN